MDFFSMYFITYDFLFVHSPSEFIFISPSPPGLLRVFSGSSLNLLIS